MGSWGINGRRGAVRAVVAGSVAVVASWSVPGPVLAAANGRHHCADHYQSSVVTTTDLRLNHVVGEYGRHNVGHVRVSSAAAGTPTGTVRLAIAGTSFEQTVRLRAGRASFALPRRLPARHTFAVTASYRPGCASFKPSSDRAYYTVVKRHHHGR